MGDVGQQEKLPGRVSADSFDMTGLDAVSSRPEPVQTGGSSCVPDVGAGGAESPRTRSIRSRTLEMTENGLKHTQLTLISTALGGGVLAVSYVLRDAGAALGVISLAIGAFLSYTSTYYLMEMAVRKRHHTYAELFSYCAGDRAGPVLDAMLFIYGIGSCVGYFVFLADFIPSLISLVAPAGSIWVSREFAIGCAVVIELPLMLQRDIGALRHIAPISVVALVYMAVVIAAMMPDEISKHKDDPAYQPISYFSFDLSALESFSICVFAFNCHLNVVPVAGKLKRPTTPRLNNISWRVNCLQVCFYSLIGITGYVSFTNNTPGDIIKAYDNKNPEVIVGRLMLTLTMIVAIPLNTVPTVRSFLQIRDYFQKSRVRRDGLLLLPSPDASPANSPAPVRPTDLLNPQSEGLPLRDPWQVPVTLVSLAVMAAIAIKCPQVADIVSLLGATIATAMMLTIPAYAMGKIMQEDGARLSCVARTQQILLYFFSLVSVSAVPIKLCRLFGVLPKDA
eukprot:TRINITY_DN74946_c0_g1_i1.p1 TRINITY_DN74946_c0_g1~~TRINITY_DN74946_c0_g1_i1.p1  ORF type:complete len:508 (-),score=56.59 TRINITY_DN74946_c0_g1_i1:274-1797(-)